jgi:phage-related baseplate assembly protein
MTDELKKLQEYPDVSFVGDWTIDTWEQKVFDLYHEKIQSITGTDQQLPLSDWRRIMLQGISYITYLELKQIEFNGKMGLLKYAIGGYLENLGAMKQISRHEATGASVTLKYSVRAARTASTPIPKGSRVTAGDNVFFATDEYAEIPAGAKETSVKATCLTAGRSGNAYSIGELSTMVDIVPFVDSVTNIDSPINGRDIETDEELRARIYAAPKNFTTGGTEGAYEYIARSFDSHLEDVLVSSPSPRVVRIVPLLEGGVVPSEAYLKELKAYIESASRKMLTDEIEAVAPGTVTYSIDLTYFINASDKNKAETIQKEVNKAIADYELWQRGKIGRDINRDELIARIKSAGAKRIDLRRPEYKKMGEAEVAIPGTVNVVYGGLEDD